MPAPVAPTEKRSPSLLAVLFWIGVALAPLAALILLVAGGDGPLRFGAVLAILSVVLIGLSIALRAESGGAAGAEELREELEQLRRELRSEIVAAAQRGNQALDQAHRAQETVAALRRRLDAAAAAVAGIAVPDAEEHAGGRARVTTEAHADGPARYPAQGRAAAGWGQPADRDEDEPDRRSQPGTRHGSERPAQPAGHVADRPQPGVYGAARTPEPDARPEPRPVGVVHHTETVHVTTRHTIVDNAEPVAGLYGGYAGRWSPAPEERPWRGAEPEERPRSGHREAEDDRARPSGDDRARTGRDGGAWSAEGGERDWPGHGGAWPGRGGEWDRSGQAGDGSWSGAPAGNRGWAGTGRSGGERGWPAGQGGDAVFSAEPAGPGDHWPRSASSAGPADQRSWPAGREGDDRSWSAGREGARTEGSWSAPATPEERSWAGQGAGWAAPDDRAWASPAAPGRAAGPDDPDGDYWSELRAGNRWAAVRDDEHGREVRVGERRAAVHADGTGTEYRVEDRWASVREPQRGYAGGAGSGWVEEGQPALPAGGVPVPDEWRPPTQRSGQPEWRQVEPEWRRAEPEPARYGDEPYGYGARGEASRAGSARPADRWR